VEIAEVDTGSPAQAAAALNRAWFAGMRVGMELGDDLRHPARVLALLSAAPVRTTEGQYVRK
jgi:hypothetical protein